MIDGGATSDHHGLMPSTSLAAESEAYIERLRVERGLAHNTLLAYSGDLYGFVDKHDGKTIADRIDTLTIFTDKPGVHRRIQLGAGEVFDLSCRDRLVEPFERDFVSQF